MAAINWDQSQSGTTYSSATAAANASVTASNPTATSLTLTAIPIGTAGNNTIATSTNWTGGSFGAADLAGGVERSGGDRGLHGADFAPDRGPDRYRRWNDLHLRGRCHDLTAADTVLIGPDVAIDPCQPGGRHQRDPTNGQAAGTTYGTGTAANTSVTATGSTATTLTLQAIQSGSVGNSTATSTNWTGGSFGAGDLTGGTDAGTFSDSIMVYDSLGNSHVLSFNFTKSSAGDWNYQITIPAADVGATGNPQVVASRNVAVRAGREFDYHPRRMCRESVSVGWLTGQRP